MSPSESGQDPGVVAAANARPGTGANARFRIPGIHRPYLVVSALVALGTGALPFLVLRTEVLLALGFLFFFWLLVHAAFLFVLFRDAGAAGREGGILNPIRVLLLLLLSTPFVHLATVFCLVVLVRNARRGLGEDAPRERAELAKLEGETGGLVAASFLTTAVALWVRSASLDFAVINRGDELPYSLRQILGFTGAGGFALFNLLAAAYYFWFLVRAVPALYRSYRRPGSPRAESVVDS